MSTHYFEVKAQAKADTTVSRTVAEVYTAIHVTLAIEKIESVGVSFPNKFNSLGDLIRVHGSFNDLVRVLSLCSLCKDAKNYDVSNILQTPDDVNLFVRTCRIQQNMSESKLRRLIKRGSISIEESSRYREKMLSNGLSNPYLDLHSASSNLWFRMWFDFTYSDKQTQGAFDSYGLSRIASLPLF